MRMLRSAARDGLLVATSILVARTGGAQADTGRADRARGEPAVDVSPTSPRAAMAAFLSLARAGQFDQAAAFLDLPDSLRQRGGMVAAQLQAVLDRHLWIDTDRLSPLPAGDSADGLPPGIDQIGAIRGPDGVPRMVRIARDPQNGAAPWRFTRSTVSAIPALYGALGDRWVYERLPEVLLRRGPLQLMWWQWLALPVLLVVAVTLGAIGGRIVRASFTRVVSRTKTDWDDAIVLRLRAPLTGALTLVALAALLPLLSLYRPAAEMSYRLVRGGLFVVFFWSLWRLVDVARQVLSHSRWARTSASSRSLLPLAGRVAKVIILAIAAVAVLSLLGFPVASLIAGLGLGGLALALAAQKTVENLFGAFSIGVDQPFREGDVVKIEDFVAVVEDLGLRSTRFRTFDRTVITLPNGRLADMRVESYTARDRLRLATTIGLVYQTTEAQMRAVLAGFERVLRAHPKIWPDDVVVRFQEFAASSLSIEVMAWFQTADWGEFRTIRQEILLEFMKVVEEAGTDFAFPTQTVRVASWPPGSPPGGRLTNDGRIARAE
jgi:MscS family membrane protein